MLSTYPAVFIKEEDGYSVVFPDLNHLSTCGDDLNETIEMANDCLAGYLYSSKLEDKKVNSSSNIKDVDLKKIAKEYEVKQDDCFVNLISVDVNKYAKEHFDKSVKKTLSIPEWLNKEATKKGINFSQTLQEALKNKLGY